MNTATISQTDYQTLPIASLFESATNPRRTFDPAKLQELAGSIRTHGLIQPITVRPKAERFEIVAGARRYRAAQIADLADVPARIIDLSDAQTLEVQIIENSQREDVHPYEEASGYKRLLEVPGYDVAALASKCSKSQSHIYARLTLLSLIPEIAEAFQQDEITASHANLLARLSSDQQSEAFPNAFRKDYRDDERHLLPAKHLSAWIQENLFLGLSSAPFPADDADLLPEAGCCLTCPSRTGFNTALFADVKDDNCTNAICFRSKIAAHIERAKSQNAALVQISTGWRPEKDRPTGELAPFEYTVIAGEEAEEGDVPPHTCPNAAVAIVTYGSGLGQQYTVCTDKNCSVHHPRRRADTGDSEEDSDFEERMQQAQLEREKLQKQKEQREKRFRSLILRFPSVGSEAQTRLILTALVRGDLDDAMERIALRFEDGSPDGDKGSDDVCADAVSSCPSSSLFGFLAELALGSWLGLPRPGEPDYLLEAEKLFPKTARPTREGKKTTPRKSLKTTTNRKA
ncbi:ParB/RepB/Spo0J family partition protein [Terriglobus roseus]|jgi:ParB family chromosome partitioning protein|uniref:Chromosome partitioning protein, ParB family n=1 Tax=Terriglobus roseus TaxID=392734 RepID=A0A1H4W257_9BACT|nr:ParB/RepB/Spo0J family partition protein [Terriglobus roseus]SEC87442.1 chromosome partitioning protein, ParB family [Terriglobus roseus]